MHITRLRLLGFKSFVEATELIIEPGLTGVVGPNGCGKSNLLEALRWVMGETSYKSMRASTMDDVIFSGSQSRPQRNAAEVAIFLDNSSRRAPAAFNDRDEIEITRRIERDAGSAYRINAHEARARDVKLLFEDAATGARSPALVRQGQISEIVNARPSDRRRILEDAAGIAGLHSRRHEAELRLKGAESNIARLSDIIGQLNAQIESLKRQSRAAKRYKELSGEIRAAEAIQLYLIWEAAQAHVGASEQALGDALRLLGIATRTEAELISAEADLAAQIQPLREQEAIRGAVVQRLNTENARLETALAAAQQRKAQLSALIEQLRSDTRRETGLIEEAETTLAGLTGEFETLKQSTTGHDEKEQAARRHFAAAEADLAAGEGALQSLQTVLAEDRAARRQLEIMIAEQSRTAERLARELDRITSDAQRLTASSAELQRIPRLNERVRTLRATLEQVEAALVEAELANGTAAQLALADREAEQKAQLHSGQIATEVSVLRKLLVASGEAGARSIGDLLTVERGYEIALGAALGDDLSISIDAAAPVHWRSVEWRHADPDPELPHGAEPLAAYVRGAPELTRRLAQIGVVEAQAGALLQARLMPGQRLVTRAGDLWRWDGFVAASDAPTAAAQRLAARNRLAALEAQSAAAAAHVTHCAAARAASAKAHVAAQAGENALRVRGRQIQAELTSARDELAACERAARDAAEKLAALGEAKTRTSIARDEALARKREGEDALGRRPPVKSIEQELTVSVKALAQARGRAADARALVLALDHEKNRNTARIDEIGRDKERWTARSAMARDQLKNINLRIETAIAERTGLQQVPQQLSQMRDTLIQDVRAAEQARSQAADALSNVDTALRDAQKRLRDVREQVGLAREGRARVEATLEAARGRRAEQVNLIRDALDCPPDQCLALAGFAHDAKLPALVDVERQLQRLRMDRERVGGVNLSAEDELAKLAEQFESMGKERAELELAIQRLRGGIGQLNREGRKRLMAAFHSVNGHFQTLFTTLFSGGEARLEMVEGEDPLDSGLEIIARPPGKKPNVLSLLSGGEQTLTALSLIFAVFLTNPSPICVLDEVDAPLDDANVDRFCALMEHMARDTDTRFLVITHHPMTMARMNRLFGVTMAEKGVSQLVSVDLSTAEQFREAG